MFAGSGEFQWQLTDILIEEALLCQICLDGVQHLNFHACHYPLKQKDGSLSALLLGCTNLLVYWSAHLKPSSG